MANILAGESCSFSRKHTAERLCAQPLVSSLARQFVRDHCHSSGFLKRPASCTALVPSYRRVFGNLCDTMCPGVSRIRLRLRTERIGGVSPNRPGPRRSRSRRRPERALSTVCGHQGLSHGISIPAWSSSRGSGRHQCANCRAAVARISRGGRSGYGDSRRSSGDGPICRGACYRDPHPAGCRLVSTG